jgi:hypothetical protein
MTLIFRDTHGYTKEKTKTQIHANKGLQIDTRTPPSPPNTKALLRKKRGFFVCGRWCWVEPAAIKGFENNVWNTIDRGRARRGVAMDGH